MENIKISTSNIFNEIDKVLNTVPAINVGHEQLCMNEVTFHLFRLRVAHETKNPVFLKEYNYYGTPISVKIDIPNDVITYEQIPYNPQD